MVATRKYKETMTCRLAEGRPDSVLYAKDSGYQLHLKYTSTKVTILSPQRTSLNRITESHCDRPTT
jgi:hypothetical protein